ncbi:KtrAB potassium uptake system, integral membrane component KtrB [hydrothermal vent metagenome]|uniref:KtrAB potassium uptake system, integral membrane component KtrB n=1 Tax=hydrothermal vent metagenome TaxID=652676 RepID=A0A3B1CD43_9ZZZZ
MSKYNYVNLKLKIQAFSQRLDMTFLTILMFTGIIFAGTILLMTPMAQKEHVTFINALFTATSATCLTGLLTINVADSFTLFGQIVIMALMELGAIGIITVSAAFAMMLGKSISIAQSSVIHDVFTASNRIDIKKLIKAVIFVMLVFELMGGVIFMLLWAPEMGYEKAAFHGIFHSISAFCNAGISSFSKGLTGLEKDIPSSAVMFVLLVAGGIGFLSIAEVYAKFSESYGDKKKKVKAPWTFQLKIILIYTFISIAAGSMLIFVLELNGAHSGIPLSEQITSALFHTASARTAGFASIDMSEFSNASLYILMLLMFVGGAPVSTAGGIKVTTFALLIGMAVSRAKGSQTVQILNRSVPEKVMSRAISIVFMAILVLTIAVFLLLITESHPVSSPSVTRLEFMPILFEAISALGTVGLSMGLTPDLSFYGKLVIIVVMLIGRLGPITIAMVIAAQKKETRYQYAEENIMVG